MPSLPFTRSLVHPQPVLPLDVPRRGPPLPSYLGVFWHSWVFFGESWFSSSAQVPNPRVILDLQIR